MGNYTVLQMFENPRRGRQARNFITNVPKILDLKSSSEQIFTENCRWVPLLSFLGQGLNQRARISFIRAFPGCYAILTSPKKGETTVYGYNPALFWVLSVSCWCLADLIFTWYDQHCSILLAEFKMSTFHFCWSGRYRSYVLRHIRLRSFAVHCG